MQPVGDMRLAILSLLLVAAAGHAQAQPPKRETAQTKREAATSRLTLKERAKPAVAPDNFVVLASATPTKLGTTFFYVGGERGRFATVRLDATKGKVAITRVRVIFEDGKSIIDDRRATLDDKRKTFVIDLGTPRAIDRIVVTTDTTIAGDYVIFGSSTTTVTVPRS